MARFSRSVYDSAFLTDSRALSGTWVKGGGKGKGEGEGKGEGGGEVSVGKGEGESEWIG